MLKSWMTFWYWVAGSPLASRPGVRPQLAQAAVTSNSLPKSQTPTFLPASLQVSSMPLSFQVTDRVPERWKIWAMSTRSEPRLPGLEDLRHPRDRELGAVGRRADLLRDDRRARRRANVTSRFSVVEVALLLGCEVAGELGLRGPLELEPDVRRLGRRRRRGRARGRPGSPAPVTRAPGWRGDGVAVVPEHAANSTAADTSPRTRACFLMPLLCCGAPRCGAPSPPPRR